jgi:osmoprotectant transport system ATP-binding protein
MSFKEDLTQPAIRYDHVSMVYEGGIEAVKDLSATIEQHEFVMLVGSSGGGKTTLLKMANALLEPTSGDVYYCGKNLKDIDHVQLRRHIGYAIQGNVLFPHLSVRRNIEYVPRLLKYDKDQLEQAVHDATKLAGIDEGLLNKSPNELSGGQQQRVGIARALAARPHMLLMDEPFGAVDAITRRTLQDEIGRIHKESGLTIMFVTHDINEALLLGTRILVINDGTLQQFDTPDELCSHPATPYVEELLEGVSR